MKIPKKKKLLWVSQGDRMLWSAQAVWGKCGSCPWVLSPFCCCTDTNKIVSFGLWKEVGAPKKKRFTSLLLRSDTDLFLPSHVLDGRKSKCLGAEQFLNPVRNAASFCCCCHSNVKPQWNGGLEYFDYWHVVLFPSPVPEPAGVAQQSIQ